jgi:hypothetical protein
MVLALAIGSLALAGPDGKQDDRKKTATGTITKVNAKAKTIVVKPTEASQQIQTQQDAPKGGDDGAKKGKPKRRRQMVFQIDENTKINSRTAQQQDAKDGPADDAQKDAFALLGAGQLVRVVYVRQAVDVDATQTQQQEAKGKKPPKGKQRQDQDDKGKDRPKPKKPRPKTRLKALSIDILAVAQQQQQDKKQGK